MSYPKLSSTSLLGAVLLLAGQLVTTPGSAQTQKTAKTLPAFEALSLKHAGRFFNGRHGRPLRFEAGKLTGDTRLVVFLYFAYPLKPWKYAAPPWINDECYEIGAVAPPGTNEDTARAMLRTALAERLGLKCHLENKETPIYALVTGDVPLKLTPAAPDVRPSGNMQMGMYKNESASLSALAEILSWQLDSEVVDLTGIKGNYKFDLDWSAELQGENGPKVDPSVFFRLVKTLGLKLDPRKVPIKFLVVDDVSKEPTPN